MADMLQSIKEALNTDSEAADSSGDTGNTSAEGGGFGSFFENIDIDMLFKAGEIFSRYNSPDKNTDLLRALKPHLREENRGKIETAIKIVKVTSLLPFLRESGLFDKMFNT